MKRNLTSHIYDNKNCIFYNRNINIPFFQKMFLLKMMLLLASNIDLFLADIIGGNGIGKSKLFDYIVNVR